LTATVALPDEVRGILLGAMVDAGRIAREKHGNRERVFLDFGRRNGKYVRLYTLPGRMGKRVPLTPELAQVALYDIRADVAKGKTIEQALARFQGATAHEHTVGHHLARWIDERNRRLAAAGDDAPSPRTVKLYATYDRKYFRPWWASKPVGALTKPAVSEWLLWLAEQRQPNGKTFKAKTRFNIARAFRAFLLWCEDREIIAKAPKLVLSKPKPPRLDRFTWEQVQQVLAAIPWKRRGLFLIGATEALRVGELRALRVVDFRDGRLHVHRALKGNGVNAPEGPTKARTEHDPMLWHPDALRWCSERAANGAGETLMFLNPRTDGAWSQEAVSEEWRRACEAAGLRYVPFGRVRHTFATSLSERGVSDRATRQRTRHTSDALDHYAQPELRPETLRVLFDLHADCTPDSPGDEEAEAEETRVSELHQELAALASLNAWLPGQDSNLRPGG
jgi:integrase